MFTFRFGFAFKINFVVMEYQLMKNIFRPEKG